MLKKDYLGRKRRGNETEREPSGKMKNPPPINIVTRESITDVVFWFIWNDKWTKEINSKSQFMLHDLVWPKNKESPIQKKINNVKNNPVLYLTELIIKDVQSVFQNKDKFRDLIQRLFDVSGKTLEECLKICLKYNINTEELDIDRAMKKIKNTKEQVRFVNSLYFDRMTSARLRILGWIYHELYGEWIKDFLKGKKGSN